MSFLTVRPLLQPTMYIRSGFVNGGIRTHRRSGWDDLGRIWSSRKGSREVLRRMIWQDLGRIGRGSLVNLGRIWGESGKDLEDLERIQRGGSRRSNGMYVVCMWCVCGVYVVCMWCVCAVYVLCMCCVCVVYVCVCAVRVWYFLPLTSPSRRLTCTVRPLLQPTMYVRSGFVNGGIRTRA